jgi:hypothetical protein
MWRSTSVDVPFAIRFRRPLGLIAAEGMTAAASARTRGYPGRRFSNRLD